MGTMTKRFMKYSLEGTEQKVLIEIEETQAGGLVKAGRATDSAKDAVQPLEVVLRQAMPVAKSVAKTLGSLTEQAPQVEVAFGIRLTEECEAIISAGVDSSNFIVTLKWKQAA